MDCSIFYLHYANNCYVAGVVYLVCEDVVLGYGWVSVFILQSVVKTGGGT